MVMIMGVAFTSVQFRLLPGGCDCFRVVLVTFSVVEAISVWFQIPSVRLQLHRVVSDSFCGVVKAFRVAAITSVWFWIVSMWLRKLSERLWLLPFVCSFLCGFC